MTAAVPALRTTWRASLEHKLAQVWRFSRLFVLTFLGQIGTQLVTTLISGNVNVTQIDRKFIVGLIVGAGEVAWRQGHPALTASEADSAPGVTIVPAQVGLPATVVAAPADTMPDPMGADPGPLPVDSEAG